MNQLFGGPCTCWPNELVWSRPLAEAHGRDGWARTSAILALIANVNRDPKKTRPFKLNDFDPYSAKDKRDAAIEVNDMTILRDAFKLGG